VPGYSLTFAPRLADEPTCISCFRRSCEPPRLLLVFSFCRVLAKSHFTAFHPDFKLQDKPPTPPETLHRARHMAMQMGLKYVYEGNIYSDGGNTICPGCKQVVITRSWHSVISNRLKDGCCAKCGTRISGVFRQDEAARRRDRTRAYASGAVGLSS
jgi:hypothetical protein